MALKGGQANLCDWQRQNGTRREEVAFEHPNLEEPVVLLFIDFEPSTDSWEDVKWFGEVWEL